MTKFGLKRLFLNLYAVFVVSSVHSCGLRGTKRTFFSVILSKNVIQVSLFHQIALRDLKIPHIFVVYKTIYS